MISRGLFQTQLNEIELLLRRLGLLDERGKAPAYPEVGASFFRKLSYTETWLWCHQNNFFDFLLADGSLLQFKLYTVPSFELSYVYYEAPLLPVLTLDDFIAENEFFGEDEEYEALRLYEFYISDPPKKETVTPIRYDYSPDQYVCGRHPVSHFHFGHNNHVRVGTRKVLRPLSFLLFILRQSYPDQWTALMGYDRKDILCRNIRENLSNIVDAYWKGDDLRELSLL